MLVVAERLARPRGAPGGRARARRGRARRRRGRRGRRAGRGPCRRSRSPSRRAPIRAAPHPGAARAQPYRRARTIDGIASSGDDRLSLRTLPSSRSRETINASNRGRARGPAPLRCGDAVGSALDSLPRPFVIRDELLGALHVALGARRLSRAGRRRRADHRRRTPATAISPPTSRCSSRSRSAWHRATSRPRSWSRSKPRGPATWSGPRSRAPASSTCTSRPRGSTRCSARWSREGERYGPRARARGPADQPRVRVGQPDRAHPRGRRPLGGGRRRARQPPRGRRCGGAPRVLPQRRGQPARHLRGVAARAVRGEEPPDDGYQGEYVTEMAARLRGGAR